MMPFQELATEFGEIRIHLRGAIRNGVTKKEIRELCPHDSIADVLFTMEYTALHSADCARSAENLGWPASRIRVGESGGVSQLYLLRTTR